MASSAGSRTRAVSGRRAVKKKRDQYHHGDLRRAMLARTIDLIGKHGVASITLRGVGEALGVSRTALYRHFANKDALLAAVATEGFATLRSALLTAWNEGGHGLKGFAQMGRAYVQFARQHPSHYQVMFGGYISPASLAAELGAQEFDAFGVLVSAIVELQGAHELRPDDPQLMAMYIWSVVHGVAMLALTGALPNADAVDALTSFAIERLQTGTVMEHRIR